MFAPWKQFLVEGCTTIHNVVVGRSTHNMRLFITCTSGSQTVVKLVDRVNSGHAIGEEDFNFRTLGFTQVIEADSQPFIGDLNGDFLEDVLFTESGPSAQIMVSLQIPEAAPGDAPAFHTTRFENALVGSEEDEPGCITKTIENKRMTVPHSAALIDFDGDCLADLFLTVQDLTTGKKFYEIYLRREHS